MGLLNFLPDSILLILQILVLLGSIFIGVKIGGIGIGYAGGIGVVLFAVLFGITPGDIPTDVILIIASVIAAISAMQVAGGMDYLVGIAEKILRKHPQYINYLAPFITYFLTILAGTGHTAFSIMPVVVDVAKSTNIKPSVPLSLSVVASQIAITASPVAAAVVYFSGVLEPFGVSYLNLLAIWISTTFAGCMITSFIISTFFPLKLDSDTIYQDRLAKGLVSAPKNQESRVSTPEAKRSVLFFLIGVICVVCYACAISKNIGLIQNVILTRDSAIISFMLVIASCIVIFCKANPSEIPQSSVFKSGMVACICVLGVAWLGNTFVQAHIDEIKGYAQSLITKYPYLLAVGLAFASMLLYSQAATAKAIMPAVIVALGITPENTQNVYILVASFAAVSALFVLPTYPTLLGAVQMDDTGTTRIGKMVFNHPFLIPGALAIALSVALGFLVAPLLL